MYSRSGRLLCRLLLLILRRCFSLGLGFRSGRLLCRLLLRLALLLPKFCLEGTRAKATVLVSMQQLRA